MGPVIHRGGLVDVERVALDQSKPSVERLPELIQRGKTTAVAFDCGYVCASVEQRASEPARSRPNFINVRVLKRAGDRSDPREELPVEDEVLAKRLVRAEPVSRDHLAQRLGGIAQAASARSAAFSAAIRIAAAIGRGSARSCPAMSNAVP